MPRNNGGYSVDSRKGREAPYVGYELCLTVLGPGATRPTVLLEPRRSSPLPIVRGEVIGGVPPFVGGCGRSISRHQVGAASAARSGPELTEAPPRIRRCTTRALLPRRQFRAHLRACGDVCLRLA